ncbi:pentatricopeptide repeat-containing protein PNM1, mitochondrial [Phalaenopsis equestris]|uniref:pentatricopeptide repeat-containing protein PNM1, mitochondrial n=1 Tax=Phalaenopsis equestris TaxID=78828 RepID=UPI0009E5FF11|nr:pentatricopeptide repeat-containing protein PNM1, mitochondrial [Phalaenopsis equestris]
MWRPLPMVGLLLRRLLPFSSSSSTYITPIVRSLSSSSDDLAPTISGELTNFASSADHSSSLDLSSHFSLHFSDVRFNTSFLHEILNISPSAGRAVIDFFRWLVRHRGFTANDTSLSHIINYLGRRHDFKAIHDVLLEYRLAAGRESFSAALDRLIRAGRASQAVHLFDCIERDYGLKPDLTALTFLVSALCSHGFTGHAERTVKRLADVIFPSEQICYTLIRGYSDELKLEDAKRLMGEIIRGGFDLGTPAYNSIIDCVCRLCRKKDPLRLLPEAQKLLLEMESTGIPRDQETFHVLIYNLCKIRKTGDAMKIFREMSQWGCSPGAETYLVLIRSLYQAARLSEAEEMIGFMRSAGFGDSLDRKAYYGFIKILCGIERVEHAMKVFRKMKSYGHVPGIKTYELLIGKLATHNEVNWANGLFKEAVAKGLPVVSKVYKVDPRYAKVKKEKKEKKRETLPEKMARKRKRLKKLRLSFVKKPKSKRRFV